MDPGLQCDAEVQATYFCALSLSPFVAPTLAFVLNRRKELSGIGLNADNSFPVERPRRTSIGLSNSVKCWINDQIRTPTKFDTIFSLLCSWTISPVR